MAIYKLKAIKKYIKKHFRLSCCILLLLLVGCAVKSSSSQPITIQTWLANPNPEIVLFWPPPLNSEILIGPKLVSGRTNHIFLFYGDGEAVSSESFTVYISEDKDFPVDFGREKVDTSSRFEQINIAGNLVNAEILTRAKLPEEGIAIFKIGNSNIVVQWQGIGKKEALQLLEENIVHISANETALIADIESHISLLRNRN